MRPISIETILVTRLRPCPRNARTHSKKQIRQIAEMLAGYGVTDWQQLESYVAEARTVLRAHRGAWLIGSFIALLVTLHVRTMNVQSYLVASIFFTVLMDAYLDTAQPLRWLERVRNMVRR